MNLTPEDLDKLCYGCGTLNRQDKNCGIKNKVNTWISVCPCSDCLIHSMCELPCDDIFKWARTRKDG